MSMMLCSECGALVDTDEDPDSLYVPEHTNEDLCFGEAICRSCRHSDGRFGWEYRTKEAADNNEDCRGRIALLRLTIEGDRLYVPEHTNEDLCFGEAICRSCRHSDERLLSKFER